MLEVHFIRVEKLTRHPMAAKQRSARGGAQNLSERVSIVVPAYKENLNLVGACVHRMSGTRARFRVQEALCTRIFSELKQADITAELLIVDDNSRDGSVETGEPHRECDSPRCETDRRTQSKC